ncbi:hypothetical protein BC827DRAFT_1246303 [Russula dissimulans]|nr:hypothetical protein BC827DRAFT_1246303 [Russula dissimulans]
MNGDQILIPVACRFVASDQWLTTQLDSTWKISEVKQYILTKIFNRSVINNDDLSSRERPVSPITFASGRNSFNGNFEGLLDDDPSADLGPTLFTEHPRQLRMRQPQSATPRVTSPAVSESPAERSASAAALPTHHYSVLAFSTGQLLEDDYSLAWYRLRPHELLELHPPGTIVRLQRDSMLEYVRPYLELDVRALRVVINDKDSHALAGGPAYAQDAAASGPLSPNKIRKAKDNNNAGESRSLSGAGTGAGAGTGTGTGGGGGSLPATPSMRKRRKMKLEWRDRYLVIRQGMLSLFKSRSDLTPVHTCSLAMLTTLRGKEDVVHAATAPLPSPHVVCAKFRAEGNTHGVPEPQLSSSPPMNENWNDPWSGGSIPRENEGSLWGRRESKEDMKQQRKGMVESGDRSRGNSIPREDLHEGRTPDVKNETLWYDVNVGDGTQGTWLVLDALDELAHSNLLRVLHRCSPDTINSTLVPNYLLPLSSPSSPSSPSSVLSSLTGTPGSSCPYPEWRVEVFRRAQQSGLGDVSDAMSWILWGGPPLALSAPKPSATELRKKPSLLTTEDLGTLLEPFDFDGDEEGGDDDDDDDCELEWESWTKDLVRQALTGPSNHNSAVTLTEPASSMHANYPHAHHHIRPTTSSSTFSSVTLSEQIGPTSPILMGRRPSDIVPGANMGLLSADSPALLTAPSVLPFQSTGITTSTVSVGGVVRTRSLISVDGGRGRGVARAMEVLSEDGGGRPLISKYREARRKRAREESAKGAVASSAPARSTGVAASPGAHSHEHTSTSTSTITSTVTVRESGSPPPPQSHGSLFTDGLPKAAATPVASTSALVSGGLSETATTSSGAGATTTATTTTIQLMPRRSSTTDEMSRPDASSSGKGKGKQVKTPTRGKTFSPERLVSKLDSALDFVSSG